MSEQEYWAIKSPAGYVQFGILMPSEDEVYEEALEIFRANKTVEQLKDKGYRAVKVRIVEVEE
jgi:hypothetical protein